MSDEYHESEFYEENPHRLCFNCEDVMYNSNACKSCNVQEMIDEFDKQNKKKLP